MFSDFTIQALAAKLDISNVKKPSGRYGPKGDYIEGWHAIAEANRIFGFDGWSYRIVEMKECHSPVKNEKGNFGVAFIARVEVAAGGITREDIGYGSGFASGLGDAYESAVKEAVTDALKRSLRTFGNPFGLALYDKSHANVSDGSAIEDQRPASKAAARPQYDALQTELRANKTSGDLIAWWRISECKAARERLPEDWRTILFEEFKSYGTQLKAAEQRSADDDQFPGSTPENNLINHPLAAG